jgi:DnaK suppressor protein
MDKAESTKYRQILEDKRRGVIDRARATMAEDMRLDMDYLADEIDLASSEYIQSFTFRLRGRDRVFLQKIDRALKKLEAGEFGVCEDCGEPINEKRLEARPQTTHSNKFKEDQERHDRDLG